MALEERLEELEASNAAFESRIQVHRAALDAMTTKPHAGSVGPCIAEEVLTMEALEQSLEHERLEVREHQVSLTEDSLTSREAKF